MGFQVWGIALIVGIEVVLLVVGVLLSVFISRGSAKKAHALWLSLALLAEVFIGLVVRHVAAINYIWPVGWMVGVGLAALVGVGLIVLIAMDVKWRPLRLAALAGVVLMAAAMFGNLDSFDVGHGYLRPLYVNRAAQIAEANGFSALLPSGLDIPGPQYGGDAVIVLGGTPGGFEIDYEGFKLHERRAAGTSEEDLIKLVSVGAKPMGGLDEEIIQPGGQITTMTIQGQPAVAVWYPFQPPGADKEGKMRKDGNTKVFANAVLVFELNGVDVRMSTGAGEANPSPDWTPQMLVDQLSAVAKTLEPAK